MIRRSAKLPTFPHLLGHASIVALNLIHLMIIVALTLIRVLCNRSVNCNPDVEVVVADTTVCLCELTHNQSMLPTPHTPPHWHPALPHPSHSEPRASIHRWLWSI